LFKQCLKLQLAVVISWKLSQMTCQMKPKIPLIYKNNSDLFPKGRKDPKMSKG